MSSTPPARRRVNPAVTVRRAQSERRNFRPWQLPWFSNVQSGHDKPTHHETTKSSELSSKSQPSNRTDHYQTPNQDATKSSRSHSWVGINHRHHTSNQDAPQAQHWNGLDQNRSPNQQDTTKSSKSQSSTSQPWIGIGHHNNSPNHQETTTSPTSPPWISVDHHHTPRTALIPPPVPRMVGRSQSVLRGGLTTNNTSGSVVRQMPVPGVQLAPMALGSPPLLLLPHHHHVPALEDMLPPHMHTLGERLNQDRLSAFLARETLPHQPRSILSCPESPLYESLISIFSESESGLTGGGTENEYQQIQVLSIGNDPLTDDSWVVEKHHLTHTKVDNSPEDQEQVKKNKVRKLYTLDVKPEKHGNDVPDAKCNCQSSNSPEAMWESLASPTGQTSRSPLQSVSSQDSHKSAIYITNCSVENRSEVTDSDIYQDVSLAPTVIHITSSDRSLESKNKFSSDSHSSKSPGPKCNLNACINEKGQSKTQINHTPSVLSTPNNRMIYSGRSSSEDSTNKVQVASRTKPPDPVYPPLTIELPESKPSPRKQECTRDTKNKSTNVSHYSSPHIITTLDPPLKHSKINKRQKQSEISQELREIPPLVVNFDSEHSDSEDGGGSDSGSCPSTLGGSTTIYLTEEDSSSIYSSVAEIYSVLTSELESLVYVYRPQPRRARHRYSTLSYRFPPYVLDRGGSSGDNSSNGSSGSSSQEGTITFVEPSYRPSNLSVGSRGHLKIDYSWSWDRLDAFVRTNSPREGGGGWDEPR